MTSPLENRLRAQIEQSSDEFTRAVCLAEIACYLARVGQFDEAEDLRKQLREVYGDGRALEVSIVLMMLDALLHFYKDLSPAARDRMARANLIAVAAGRQRWIALTAAWLAHIDFNLSRFEDMARNLRIAFDALSSDDGTAECRLALVLGDSFLYCGKSSSSQRWYDRARLLANRLGDQAAIGAMIYNRAALRVSVSRLEAITCKVDVNQIASVWAEVKSALNYQAVAGTVSLDHLIGSARVGALVLQSNFQQTLLAIDAVLATGAVPAPSGELLLLKADRALCLAEAGRASEARSEIDLVVQSRIDSLSWDDAALVHWSLSQASAILGDESTEKSQRESSLRSLEQHQKSIVDLLSRIAPFSDTQQINT